MTIFLAWSIHLMGNYFFLLLDRYLYAEKWLKIWSILHQSLAELCIQFSLSSNRESTKYIYKFLSLVLIPVIFLLLFLIHLPLFRFYHLLYGFSYILNYVLLSFSLKFIFVAMHFQDKLGAENTKWHIPVFPKGSYKYNITVIFYIINFCMTLFFIWLRFLL